MSLNTAIIPGSLVNSAPALVAEALRSLVSDNMNDQARQVFKRYRQVQPESYDLVMLYADILLNADQLDEAEILLEEELRKNPDRFELLFRIARLDENRGEYINAYDLYRQAEMLAATAEQKKEANAALLSIRGNIRSEVTFKPDSYTVMLSGNKRPLNMQYNFERLMKRRDLLKAILMSIDPAADTVLEIECDGGIIARNLHAHGFSAEGTSADLTDLLLTMGLEYVNMLINVDDSNPNYHNMAINQKSIQSLGRSDVILFLPVGMSWFEGKNKADVYQILREIAAKAGSQFFFYLPPEWIHNNALDSNLKLLKCRLANSPDTIEPLVCFENSDGGILYLVDHRQKCGKSGRSTVLPHGLEVISNRSNIFAVDTAKCRSLNGFGFTHESWNHFRATLEEISLNPGQPYKDSTLKRFYDLFQPRNRQEHLFGKEVTNLYPLDQGWTLHPWLASGNRLINPGSSPVTRVNGNHHYGPNSEAFGKAEYERLKITFDLISKNGYLPEIFPDGYVRGFFLKDGGDYRFIVLEGQHRMATIGLLAIPVIKARFKPGFDLVVDLEDIENWPQVKNGLYSVALAEKVFRYYFEEDGRRKAQMLGLLEATNALTGQ